MRRFPQLNTLGILIGSIQKINERICNFETKLSSYHTLAIYKEVKDTTTSSNKGNTELLGCLILNYVLYYRTY